MEKWTIKALAIVAVLLLLPLEALAGICFSTSGFPVPVTFDFDLMSQGQLQPGKFLGIGGEVFGWCPGTTPALMSGMARPKSDGKIQFGFTIHAVRVNPACIHGEGEGEVEADLSRGLLTVRSAQGSVFVVELLRATCSG